MRVRTALFRGAVFVLPELGGTSSSVRNLATAHGAGRADSDAAARRDASSTTLRMSHASPVSVAVCSPGKAESQK